MAVVTKKSTQAFSIFEGEGSLLLDTLTRLKSTAVNHFLLVTGENSRFYAERDVEEAEISAEIFLEPAEKNTAGAAIAAAYRLAAIDEQAIMVLCPSDHKMGDSPEFSSAVEKAILAATSGCLVTIGIEPTVPSTAFGYIEVENKSALLCNVLSFKEKPNLKRATEFVESQNYFWNSGIFVVQARSLIAMAKSHVPTLGQQVEEAVVGLSTDSLFLRPLPHKWAEIDQQSFDCAIAENVKDIKCIPFHEFWSDLGDWFNYFGTLSKDENHNALKGSVSAFECNNVGLLSTENNIHLVGLGLNDVFAVATSDAVLIAPFEKSQEVKQVVASLEKAGVSQALENNRVLRPWGWFERLMTASNFQIKKLYVKPNSRLSLQRHSHRAENWIVVQGKAEVVIGNATLLLGVRDSVLVPVGAKHRLSNPTDEILIVIEVQTGDYFGEDDIERFEDDFDRSRFD